MNELINLGNGAMVKITMLKGEAGNSIATITKTSTSGLVDTYTVTLTDGTQTTFQVTNGKSIDHITKTDTQGAIDTYTIYLTDGSVGGTFEVKNATGVIDENFSSSSTNAIQTATVTNVISGVENGATASKSYNAGDFILKANKMYEVTDTVAQGDTWTVGVNLEETNIGLELKQINTSLSEIIQQISNLSAIKSIQRGTFTQNATSYASKTINISTVDPNKCVLIPSAGGQYSPCMASGTISATSFTVYVGSSNGSGIIFGWQLIEFN